MARYSCSFYSPQSTGALRNHLSQALQACNIEVIHDDPEYLVGREMPGHVSFAKLVVIEALVDKPEQGRGQSKINCVLKNEELPLSRDNHCRQMFDSFKRAVQDRTSWQLT
ncbi:MAG: hypothetical protein AAGG51_01895 [Cyanobacteria bacterium P01_G01_bin.54]